MTAAKGALLTSAVAGSFALGLLLGPLLRQAPEPGVVASSTTSPATSTAPVKAEAPRPMSPEAEPVQEHVKQLLTQGTNVKTAAEGFSSAEQFVTVAQAARNTDVPFVLLKHRVLTQGRSLASAIRESKPELNGALEANRARAEARADLARMAG